MTRPAFFKTIPAFSLSALALALPALAQESSSLSLQQLVQRVRSDGMQVQSARLQRDLTATGIERAEAAFQPQLSASISNGYNSQINTYEESLARRSSPDYWRKGVDSSLALSQLLSPGTKLEAKVTSSRFDTNINRLDTTRPPGSLDNRSLVSLNLVQPLARDAGTAVTQARADVARLDTQASTMDLQRIQTTALADALVAYYELALAGERLKVAEAKIGMGERLLNDARELLAKGRLPEADVWEVENALARFRAELTSARQGEREKGNRLKSLLMISSAEQSAPWRAADGLPQIVPVTLEPEKVRTTALERREDLKRLRLSIQREDIQVMYAQNQAKPRLDAIVSYGRGSLALSWRDSFSYMPSPTWSVGVQAQMPLGPNRQGEADIAAALARQRDADLKLRNLEIEITNEVDTALGLYQSAVQRHADWAEIARREKQAAQLERQRLAAGRSAMREVLNREERALNAQLGWAEQRAAMAQAQVLLSSAQGVLEEQWP